VPPLQKKPRAQSTGAAAPQYEPAGAVLPPPHACDAEADSDGERDAAAVPLPEAETDRERDGDAVAEFDGEKAEERVEVEVAAAARSGACASNTPRRSTRDDGGAHAVRAAIISAMTVRARMRAAARRN